MTKEALEKALKREIEGEVRFDEVTCSVYSTDASIYEIFPLGVVFPKSTEDIIRTVRIAHDAGISTIARGAATGITGGCLGPGLIIDTSKYLNKIINIDLSKRTATCQPGVIQDDLNENLKQYGLRLGPDTSTGNRATLGGMLANNAAGSRSLRYGCMSDHIKKVELGLAQGKLVSFETISIEEWQLKKNENPIYSTCWDLRNSLEEEIKKQFFSLPRRVSGYNLNSLIQNDFFNPCCLVAGSEGTLGIVSELTLNLCPIPGKSILCLIECDSLREAFLQVDYLLTLKPLALEIIDHHIIEAGKKSPAFMNRLEWIKEGTSALLIVELDGEESHNNIKILLENYSKKAIPIHSKELMQEVWDLRKAGLGLLLSKRDYTRAIAFVEDVSVRPIHLADFIDEFLSILGPTKQAGIYGHAGSGCMHIRPYLDLRSQSDRQLMVDLMKQTTQLIKKYQGTLSGEHGDGLIRSWLNKELFGEKIYNGFLEIKKAFDPHNLMNPNKIVAGPPVLENLRRTPFKKVETYLNFDPEGGLNLAVDMCNGNGLCRKKEGTMCPSFQATLDEKDSTRARANALRQVLADPNALNDLSDEGIHQVLDLCISCKGCKTECPSLVDMAKLKIEALYHYQKKHGITLRNRLFGHVGKLFSIGSHFPGFMNFLSHTSLVKWFLEYFGITIKRPLPKLAQETFEKWTSKQPQIKSSKSVVLFNDTFTNFINPHIGIATYELFQKLGYNVIVPPWHCCGRTAISKGLLSTAKKNIENLITLLNGYSNLPLVVLEPSCLSVLIDDLKYFNSSIALKVYSLEEFLIIKENNFFLINEFNSDQSNVYVHIHCHQKALLGLEYSKKLFQSLPGVNTTFIETGCCGMAGSFGFEKEHENISIQIGELRLFPFIRKTPIEAPIISNGTSCRSQILEGTDRDPIHLSEYINNGLK